MDFDSNSKPIYLQIADFVCDRIVSGEIKPGERVPSVRDYGASIGVNPNTVMRTYEKLTDDGIIYSQRGMGFFVSPDALEIIKQQARTEFMEVELPKVAKRMQQLSIDIDTLSKAIAELLK